MKHFNFNAKNGEPVEKGTYWVTSTYRDRESGDATEDWRMENLVYDPSYVGEKPSRIRIYGSGELVFDGTFKDLVDIIKEHNENQNN